MPLCSFGRTDRFQLTVSGSTRNAFFALHHRNQDNAVQNELKTFLNSVKYFSTQVNYCLELDISADSASRFFIPFGLLSSVARVVTGRICDVIWVNTTYIYQFGALLDGFAIVVLPVIRNYTGIQVFAVIYGIADGVLISTMNSLLMFSVDEKRRAAALGLGNSLLSLAIASGPPFAGLSVVSYW